MSHLSQVSQVSLLILWERIFSESSGSLAASQLSRSAKENDSGNEGIQGVGETLQVAHHVYSSSMVGLASCVKIVSSLVAFATSFFNTNLTHKGNLFKCVGRWSAAIFIDQSFCALSHFGQHSEGIHVTCCCGLPHLAACRNLYIVVLNRPGSYVAHSIGIPLHKQRCHLPLCAREHRHLRADNDYLRKQVSATWRALKTPHMQA